MADKGFKVEYVPPQDNCAILQGLFEMVRERLYGALPEGIIDPAPLKVTQEKDAYYCKLVLKDGKGEISFVYDDYIPEFDSFEEYLHSGSGDRGSLDIASKVFVPLSESEMYKSALQQLGDTMPPNVDYRIRKDHGEINAHRSIGICLLSWDERDVEFIYESALQLWNQIIIVMDAVNVTQRS